MAHGHHDHNQHAQAHAPAHGAVNAADIEYLETPPGSSYEHTDASVWTIVKFGIWLAVAAVIIHVGLGLMYSMYIEQGNKTQEPGSPLVSMDTPRIPAGPRLQQFPRNDMYQLYLQEQQRLGNYGWVNKEAGTVHIPIADAMRLTIERGLPARTQDPVQSAETPGLMPSDSSSGRLMETRRQ